MTGVKSAIFITSAIVIAALIIFFSSNQNKFKLSDISSSFNKYQSEEDDLTLEQIINDTIGS